MVLADGIIDAREMEALHKIGTEEFGLSNEEMTRAIQEQGTSFDMPQTQEGKIKFLHHLCTIAWADGEIDETERVMAKKYAVRMGFKEDNADAIVDFMLNEVQNNVSASEVVKKILN